MILISGKAENGKTTLAEYLKNHLEEKGFKVIITRYAYYLKDLATRYCGWDGTKDKKGRELLQHLGTETIREKLNKPHFHVGRTCEDIEICQDYIDYIIIDDARFPNEIYYPKSVFEDKVISIRINRMKDVLNGIPYESSLTEEQKKHSSEIALDNFEFDITLYPDSKKKIEEYIEGIILPYINVK